MIGNIHPDLLPLARPLAELNLDPRNARTHDARNLDAIKASLSEFGQRRLAVVQRKGMVVRAGNGMVLAAKALGWDQIACLVVDDPDPRATRYAIADNRTAELARWDFDVLAESFRELAADGLAADVPGWSQHDVAVFTDPKWRPGGEAEFPDTDKPTKRSIVLSADAWTEWSVAKPKLVRAGIVDDGASDAAILLALLRRALQDIAR